MNEWTEAELDILEWHYTFKTPLIEISSILNRSVNAIRGQAYKRGFSKKNFTNEEKQYVINNYKSYNLKEIAKYLNASTSTTCRLAKQLGVERNHKVLEHPQGYTDENGLYHKNGWVRKTEQELYDIRSIIMKKWHKTNEHPRGMLGKNHSDKVKQDMSDRVIKYWEGISDDKLEERRIKQRKTKIKNGTLAPTYKHSNPYSRTKSGKRKDIGNIYFRSAWEANIARYYNYLNIKWEFEPKRFVFDTIKRGSVSYLPDFYLPEKDKWIEVKGWMDAASKTKIKRFKKYYPEEYKKFELIGQKEYKIIEKKYKHLIKGWE